MRLRALATLLVPILGAALLAPSPVTADETNDFGPYVALNAAYGINLVEGRVNEIVPGAVEGKNSPGLNARLGLRLFSWLAIEGQYEWMDRIETTWSGGGSALATSSHVVTGNAKLLLPIWRIQPYLLAGIGANFYDLSLLGSPAVSGTALAGRVGGGVDLYFTKHLALNAEFAGVLSAEELDVSSAAVSPLHYLSLSAGLLYRF